MKGMGGCLKIVLGQKLQPIITNYRVCFGSIPERKGSISPASFYGQLPDYWSHVFDSFAYLMFSAFLFKKNERAYILS